VCVEVCGVCVYACGVCVCVGEVCVFCIECVQRFLLDPLHTFGASQKKKNRCTHSILNQEPLLTLSTWVEPLLTLSKSLHSILCVMCVLSIEIESLNTLYYVCVKY